ncbi:MAG: MBL fold metallo-hydrolase [Arenicella sp.]
MHSLALNTQMTAPHRITTKVMRLHVAIKRISMSVITGALLASVHANADDAPLSSQKLSNSIYLLSGKGGNIGVSIGKDGTFLIDDKFAPMTNDIIEEIKKVGGSVPKFVLNTHWHGDHTGGNENLGKQGSIIVAHENVRKRLTVDSFIKAFNNKTTAYPEVALPVITFTQTMQFHLNDDGIEVIHIPKAHTDGDSVVYFTNDNVLHTGDIFFNGFFPFIDTAHGGTLKGTLKATEQLISMTDESTKIIPGHGPLANKADLVAYRDMLAAAYLNLKAQKSMGNSLEQAQKAKPLKDLDKKWSNGIFKADKWIEVVYDGLD